MYSEFAKDPKVQSLDEKLQRRLVMVFCLNCSNELSVLTESELAFALNVSLEDVKKTKSIFLKKGFIRKDWSVTSWCKRQPKHPTSAQRTRDYRKRKSEADDEERHRDVTVTLRDAKCDAVDIDRDKYKKKLKQKKSVTRKPEETLAQGDALISVCDFEKFWEKYPSKVAKKIAHGVFKKINPDEITMKKIMSSIDNQKRRRASKKRIGKFVPDWKHPSTWLRGQCWLDEEYEEDVSHQSISKRLSLTEKEIRKIKQEQKSLSSRITKISIKIGKATGDEKIKLFETQQRLYQEMSGIEAMLDENPMIN